MPKTELAATCIGGRRRHAFTVLILSMNPYRLTLPDTLSSARGLSMFCRNSRIWHLPFIAVDLTENPQYGLLHAIYPSICLSTVSSFLSSALLTHF